MSSSSCHPPTARPDRRCTSRGSGHRLQPQQHPLHGRLPLAPGLRMALRLFSATCRASRGTGRSTATEPNWSIVVTNARAAARASIASRLIAADRSAVRLPVDGMRVSRRDTAATALPMRRLTRRAVLCAAAVRALRAGLRLERRLRVTARHRTARPHPRLPPLRPPRRPPVRRRRATSSAKATGAVIAVTATDGKVERRCPTQERVRLRFDVTASRHE